MFHINLCFGFEILPFVFNLIRFGKRFDIIYIFRIKFRKRAVVPLQLALKRLNITASTVNQIRRNEIFFSQALSQNIR